MQPPEPDEQASTRRRALSDVRYGQANGPRETKAPKPSPALSSAPAQPPPSLHDVLAGINPTQEQYVIQEQTR